MTRITFLPLLLLALISPLMAQTGANPHDIDHCRQRTSDACAQLAAFESQQGIAAWPRLDGCEYAESFKGKVVGLVLHVSPSGTVASRMGRCHVPTRHVITNPPPSLSPGLYVAAATKNEVPGSPPDDRRNTGIRVLGWLGPLPDNSATHSAAIQKICEGSRPPFRDLDCEILHEQRTRCPDKPSCRPADPAPANAKPVRSKAIILSYFEFPSGRHDLTSLARPQAAGVSRWLLANPEFKVVIRAHCNDGMSRDYAIAVCQKRSQAVYRFLLEAGVPDERMATVSYGNESAREVYAMPGLPAHNRLAVIELLLEHPGDARSTR